MNTYIKLVQKPDAWLWEVHDNETQTLLSAGYAASDMDAADAAIAWEKDLLQQQETARREKQAA